MKGFFSALNCVLAEFSLGEWIWDLDRLLEVVLFQKWVCKRKPHFLTLYENRQMWPFGKSSSTRQKELEALEDRTRRTRFLLAWILLNLLLICPEAGMVLFMAIYFWVSLLLRFYVKSPFCLVIWKWVNQSWKLLKSKYRACQTAKIASFDTLKLLKKFFSLHVIKISWNKIPHYYSQSSKFLRNKIGY